MKVNQALIYDKEIRKINCIDKNTFLKLINGNDIKTNKMLTLTYVEILKKYSKDFKVLDKGIYYYNKRVNGKILICLIDKSIDDFINICDKEKVSSSFNNNVLKNNVNIVNNETKNMISKEKRKDMIKKRIRQVAVVSMVALASINMIACKKAETETFVPPFEVEHDAGGSDGMKINNIKVTPNSSSENKSQPASSTNKYAKTYDGQVTGRTRIENGQILEWAENYPEDKTIKPTNIEYPSKYSDGSHFVYYDYNGETLRVAVNGSSEGRTVTNSDGQRITICRDNIQSNEEVLHTAEFLKAYQNARDTAMGIK